MHYITHGLKHGFDIGFKAPTLTNNYRNLLSATEHQQAVTTAIIKEITRGHISGPFSAPPLQHIHCSPLGSRDKKDGSRRLIMDLSQPRGSSINDGIDKEEFTVQYSHFDEATDIVHKMGTDCLMSKIDVQHAFRLLPVKQSQWHLLAIRWLNLYYINTRLPFGLRSAPNIFNKFADLICWILHNNTQIQNIIHYSDDYFNGSPPNIRTATNELSLIKQTFQHLNVPIATEKISGPSTTITYLGIQIDSHTQTISLPQEKINDLATMLPSWLNRKKCTQKELLSLIGKLAFASKVIRPGRIFLRRLITTAHTVKRLHHFIYLNKEAQKDIKWWRDNFKHLNRKHFIPDNFTITTNDIKLFTDASSIGFGAIYNNAWIQSKWPTPYTHHSIDYKELFAIWAACITWGSEWERKRIIFITDNKPITELWQSGSSPSADLMDLIRNIYSIAVLYQFSVSFKHILGHFNPIADALSRYAQNKFHLLAPFAHKAATQLPQNTWTI